jgi:hypothetical protein
MPRIIEYVLTMFTDCSPSPASYERATRTSTDHDDDGTNERAREPASADP